MTDPVPGLLNSYDISPEEKKAIQMQNFWGALTQGGMALMAAGSRVSDGQRAQLLMQAAQPFANMGAMNQAMMQSASREKLNAAAAQRLAEQDQAKQRLAQVVGSPEFAKNIEGMNPAMQMLLKADPSHAVNVVAGMQKQKPSEGEMKRQATLRAAGGDQALADRLESGMQKMVVGPDGQPYVVNVATGQVISGSVGNKPMTEGQANAALYADRMRSAEPIIMDNTTAGQNTFDKLKAQVPGVGNYLVSEGFQKYDQARRDFINATLRRESGAVISDAEFDNANKQYFPQPGDAADVLKQKEQNRRIAIEGISRAAGPSYSPPQPQQSQPQAGGSALLDEARKAIAAGAPRDAVAARLRERGIDPGGL